MEIRAHPWSIPLPSYLSSSVSSAPSVVNLLRRGLYLNLARISDLGVKILEIPRTDFGPGGWGGRVATADGEMTEVKALDISDLGLVHYLKTGIVEATRTQRNQFVSNPMKKPEIWKR